MYNWYLVYTKPKNEDSVTSKLEGCGFEVFNPKLKERKYVRRKLRDVVSPFFPCYIFVKFKIPESYRLIKYTRGVRKVVGTENQPTPVHQVIIDSIRDRMDNGLVAIRPRKFSPGEEVLIKGGPFEGLDAIFIREMHGLERVSILLKAINARVIVESAFLEKG
jgi:transcription elongation factor/antiterminator RfaH